MPKTRKKFNWEVLDKDGLLIDILTMSRDESKKYKKDFPEHILMEIDYNDD